MKIRSYITLAALAASLFSMLAAPAHQTTGDDPTKPGIECGANVQAFPDDNTQGAIYLDVRYVNEEPDFSIWGYQESNGHQGLQTKALTESIVLGDLDADNCTTAGHTDKAPDTVIF